MPFRWVSGEEGGTHRGAGSSRTVEPGWEHRSNWSVGGGKHLSQEIREGEKDKKKSRPPVLTKKIPSSKELRGKIEGGERHIRGGRKGWVDKEVTSKHMVQWTI